MAPPLSPCWHPAVSRKVLDHFVRIARRHVDVDVVLPLQQSGRIIAHCAEQRACTQSVAETMAWPLHVANEGVKQIIVALRYSRLRLQVGWQ